MVIVMYYDRSSLAPGVDYGTVYGYIPSVLQVVFAHQVVEN